MERFVFAAKVVETSTCVGVVRRTALAPSSLDLHSPLALHLAALIMFYRPFLSPALLGWLVAVGVASSVGAAVAQLPPPPLPPPAGEEGDDEMDADAGGDSEEESPEANADMNADVAPTEVAPTAAADPSGEPWEQPVEAAPSADTSADAAARKKSLRRQSSLTGSTGLHRISEAGSGAAGTFRMSLTGSYFGKKGFLCHSGAQCLDPVTGEDLGDDRARHSDAIVAISATPFSFLEAFMSIHNSATSNTNGTPGLLQVVGDTYLGLKGFMPEAPDRIFSFGGEADVRMLTGTGGVGLAGGATSFSMTGLASLNLDNRTSESERVPLRAHANLGYKFDNSGAIVRDLENTARPEGRGAPIQRTERYGLGISRVDLLEIGLGTEYIHDFVRPFVEWTLDIPVNRQRYVCDIQGAESRGDECLGVAAGLSTSPSRFTLGARVFPWQASGLALTGAVDLGTGGKKRFLEETTPEAPYTLWFGLGYAVDTVPPEPQMVEVASPYVGLQPETRRYILGQVVAADGNASIPDAIIRYEGVPMTGLVADETGQFITQDLPPGEYTFRVFAEQFKEGTCSVVIPETVDPSAPPVAPQEKSEFPPLGGAEDGTTEDAAPAAAAVSPGDAPYMDPDGNLLVPLRCELKELPRVADITGLLVDAATGGPVADAKVRITDKLNRSLELAVDAQGSFQFRNVPFGEARLTVTAPGYLNAINPIQVEKRGGLQPQVMMHRRPEKLDLTIGKTEIVLGTPIRFVPESAEVALDSMVMVEQLAEALKENEQLDAVEIQVHTDDSGSATYSRRLSQERATRLADLLSHLGVPKRKLTARGFGPDQPLVPNVSEANRARNNRVQVLLK